MSYELPSIKLSDNIVRTNVQIFLPVSVSKLVVYNIDIMKVIQYYEMMYLRNNYSAIIDAAIKKSSSGLRRKLKDFAINLAIVGAVLHPIIALFSLYYDFKDRKRKRIFEAEKADLSKVQLTTLKVSDTLSISMVSQVTVDEFTTSDKILAYSLAQEKNNLIAKESVLATEYDRIIFLQTAKPVYVVTDIEYENHKFEDIRERADFIIVNFTDEIVKIILTANSKVIETEAKLSEILLNRKYEEIDLSSLNSILQKLTKSEIK